jgi:hypothetical protein
MEKFLIDLFGNWAIIAVPVLSGILMSFIIEAIFQLTPDVIKQWYVTLVTALVVGVGLSFLFPIILPTQADRIFIAVANVAVSIVFSKLVGKVIVEKLIAKSVGKIGG